MDWILTIHYRWPHQGLVAGFEVFPPDEDEDYLTVKIHVFIFSFVFDIGPGVNPYI